MSRSFDRNLKRAAEMIRRKREPEPDFTGWEDVDIVTWKLNNGATLQELVRKTTPSWERHLKLVAAKRERERRAYEARPPKPEPEPEPKPASKAEPEAPAPSEPQPKEWWEERARWNLRGPIDEDERRGRPMYECTHEYDPMTYDDEEYDED